MKRLLLTLVIAAISGISYAATFSADPVKKGEEIALKSAAVNDGFGDSVAKMEMILKNQHGQSSTRYIKLKTLEVKNDGDKSISIFSRPRDVKGTAFLSFTHKTGDDDRWLYLPALRRVKRISSSNQSGPFMGSEFAYEDLGSQEVEKFTYKYIRDENLGGKETHVIERYPVDKNSGYTKQTVWVDQAAFTVQKIEFFDRRGSHLKTLMYKKYQKFENKHWRALLMEMENHQSGKSTSLVWSDYQFGLGLTSRDFSKNSLKRVR
ncbi:MAG: outer membrane lipoprotein-sorting protein [SAR324 cluster bacterium]|uniref:Outer membrane lipoprotein-sorting protein n=1 Tax=SAR324 cluster bacterium TaxID=2024889 RepID=A0A2A4T0Q8_9DELT|nr:MAG: outer membrane lipoprotein-sorting protein [SAR324 cluster bacterium]